MDTFETMLSRRSVRSFDNKPIEKTLIEKILQAAMSAPSGANEQAWHFIVVTEPTLLNQMAQLLPYGKMCAHAAAAIVVCADTNLVKLPNFWTQDLSAATQNILLAIRALDLGGVWLGIYPEESRVNALKQLFDLGPNIIPFSTVALGYTSITQRPADRYQENRIHYNYW